MPHIKWVGIINSEIADYQKGTMDCSAKKMALPATVQEMMIKALPFTVLPFTVIFLSIFLKTFFAGEMTISPIFFVIGYCRIYCRFYRIDCPRMAARYCISCKRNCLYRFSPKIFCRCCFGLLSIEKMEIYPNVFTSFVIRDCAYCNILV